VRPVFDLARNAVFDQLELPHDQVQSLTLKSIVTNAALGMLTAGHNIEFKDYSAGQIAGILTRAQVCSLAGLPLDAELTPQQMAEAAKKIGLSNIDAQRLSAPLNKQEIDVFNAAGTRAAQMKASDQSDGVNVTGITARHAVVSQSFGKDGNPIATSTSIDTEAKGAPTGPIAPVAAPQTENSNSLPHQGPTAAGNPTAKSARKDPPGVIRNANNGVDFAKSPDLYHRG